MSSVWQRVGAGGGGTVAALAGSPDLLFAATSVGVFRSRDGGLSWQPPNAGTLPPLAEGLALSPDFPRDRTLYTCAVDGLYRSTDAGESWEPILVGSRIASAACVDANIVLAGTEAEGVVRSADGGRSWQSASAGLLDLRISCLAARRELAFAGTQSGLHRSRNAGQTWRAVGPETPIQCVAISADGGPVFVGTERDGLFRSLDGGTTWQPVVLDDCRSVSALAIVADQVIVATASRIAVSNDAGASWRTTPSPGAVLALAICREGLLAGLYQEGIVCSVDDGVTWSPPHAGMNARVVSAAAFGRDGTLYVADIDAGVRVSRDAGTTWHPCTTAFDPPSAMAISADSVLFAASSGGIYRSSPGSDCWSLLLPSSTFEAADITDLAIASDGALFVATRRDGEAGVWRSTADGFERCLLVKSEHTPRLASSSEGLVIAAVGDRLFNLGDSPSELTFSQGAITALAIQEHTIFLGTTDGVYLSQDMARTFVQWAEGLPGASRIVALGALDEAVYAITFGGQLWRRHAHAGH